MLPTVTVATAPVVCVTGEARHVTVVPDAHDDVAQSALATVPVGDVSTVANARPPSVAVSPPLKGMLP